mgnify:CR=1 FL=1
MNKPFVVSGENTSGKINPDIDPTGTLSKRQLKLFKYWINGIKQKDLPAKTNETLAWIKKEIGIIYDLLNVRDKGKAVNVAWQKGILTIHNSRLPKESEK